MPYLIKHIDQIAREKNRDVLFIVFDRDVFDDGNHDEWPARKDVISWFESHNIKIQPCGNIASEHGFDSYSGQLYIDVPFDESNPEYTKARDYLENPDGSMRTPGITFCYLPLERAMKNKHHDEPGFWEKLWE